MRTAFVIFNGLTVLDFVGVYDPLTRLKTMDILPEFEWDVCAVTPGVDLGLYLVEQYAGRTPDGVLPARWTIRIPRHTAADRTSARPLSNGQSHAHGLDRTATLTGDLQSIGYSDGPSTSAKMASTCG
ncbi:MAG: hypothetical protein WD021_07305 [Rhodothermales bacterium]